MINHASRILLQDSSKSIMNRKNDNGVITDMKSSLKFFNTIVFFFSSLNSFQSFIRSSHRRCFIKKVVLKSFVKFTGKHLCQGLFLNKVSGLRLKETLVHAHFIVHFAKSLETSFSQNTSGRLLLFRINTITGSRVMTIFIYKKFDQISGY